jgi:spore coat protein U-like protein
MAIDRNARHGYLVCAALAAAIAGAGMSAPALAATATASLTVSATVLATCAVAGGTIPFGTYTGAQIDQGGTLTVTCSSGTAYTIALDAGGGSSATIAARKMTATSGAGSGTATLNYALYRETGRSTNWGNTGTSDTVAGIGNGLPQTVNVYGRLPANQALIIGAYADAVTVTLTY